MGFPKAVHILGTYGGGKIVAQTMVNPDEYCVLSPSPQSGSKSILEKRLGTKDMKLVYSANDFYMAKNIAVSLADQQKFAISDQEIIKHANWACIIQEYYSAKREGAAPLFVEWIIDGNTRDLLVVPAAHWTADSGIELPHECHGS